MSGDSGRPRAQHGDAPRWIAWPILVTVVGIPLGVLAYVLAGAAARDGSWREQAWPGPAISVAVVATLLWLAWSAARRRPLGRVDRSYYRLALLVIGMLGFLGTWHAGLVLGAALLALSLVLDRRVDPEQDDAPVTRDARFGPGT
ncbi:hypothetical protein [Janibacter sp. LM]|uniref:hypothetical protein n=1 Tax=Janibacter sp. LM TaxID=3144845 RepID=UPI0031F645AC